MISKERLQELINQGATIYWICGRKVEAIPLKHKYHKFFINDDELYEYNEKLGIGMWGYKISRLFETLEEAEWHKEFGCIERTDYLDLPTYEWMQPKEDEQDVYYSFYNYKHELMGIRVTKQKIALYKSYRCSDLTSTVDIFDNTKENYILACRKAKQLFLGEEEQ